MPLVAPGFSTEREVHRLRTLYQLLSSLARAGSLQDVYDSALASLLASTIADRAAILLFDDDGVLRFKASRGLSPEYRAAITGHCPWPRGFSNADAIPVTDVDLDPQLASFRPLLGREKIRSLAFVPLALDAGVFGMFLLCCSEPHEWTPDEIGAAQVIASHVALVWERKRAELAQERSEQMLASVVENSQDAIITKNLSGIISSWNRAAEELLGHSAAEAIGSPITLIAPEDRRHEMAELLGRIGRGERIEHFETQRKTKDGRILDVSLTISPIRGRDGRITGASKIMRDITERRRAEHERVVLLEREQRARATAELLNQVGPILLTERDPARLIHAITEIGSALVGAESACFVPGGLDRGDPSHAPGAANDEAPDPLARFTAAVTAELFEATLRRGQIVRSPDLPRDTRFAAPSDQPAIRSCLAVPVASRLGEIMGGLLFAHSAENKFTEYEEGLAKGIAAQAAIALDNARLFEQAQWAQEELQRSNEELRRTNEDLEAFVYSASHDLKEPLRTVILCSELVERSAGAQLSPEAAGFLASAIHGARTMEQLLKDLLTYTTAARSVEGPPPAVDSAAVLAEVVDTLKASIDQSEATVTAADLPVVSIHPSRLAQIFQNLVSNALKYRGEQAPHVQVSAVEKDGWTVFSVKDNGIGIDPENAGRIFGLFKRLHSRQRYPGSGLGLAICQRIVEHYGGRIWLDRSETGAGSVFCFAIPSRGKGA